MPGADQGRPKAIRVLAVASSGGHWEQLMMLRSAFAGWEVHYATTVSDPGGDRRAKPMHFIPDCNRNARVKAIVSALRIGILLVRLRPTVVITTGALPGLLALIFAKRLGARTIWVDSIANAEEMSLAGLKARSHADLWLSQWPEVARSAGAEYAGAVL